MKISWGTGIAIFYGLFVLVLVFAVFQSTKVDHSLVTDDYYQKDLEYQTQINKEVNAQNLEEDLRIQFSDGDRSVRFEFPKDLGSVSGNILFFRPSNESLDFEVAIQTGESGEQVISMRDRLPGLWKVKVDWRAGEKAYYKEANVIF